MSDGGKQAKPKDERSDSALDQDITRLRGELAETLDALEYKLDVPARFAERMEGVRQAWDERPLVVAAIAVGALCAACGLVAGAVALARR